MHPEYSNDEFAKVAFYRKDAKNGKKKPFNINRFALRSLRLGARFQLFAGTSGIKVAHQPRSFCRRLNPPELIDGSAFDIPVDPALDFSYYYRRKLIGILS